MNAVVNYTLEVRNNLVGTTINITFQEFIETRVRACLIVTILMYTILPVQCQPELFGG